MALGKLLASSFVIWMLVAVIAILVVVAVVMGLATLKGRSAKGKSNPANQLQGGEREAKKRKG